MVQHISVWMNRNFKSSDPQKGSHSNMRVLQWCFAANSPIKSIIWSLLKVASPMQEVFRSSPRYEARLSDFYHYFQSGTLFRLWTLDCSNRSKITPAWRSWFKDKIRGVFSFDYERLSFSGFYQWMISVAYILIFPENNAKNKKASRDYSN